MTKLLILQNLQLKYLKTYAAIQTMSHAGIILCLCPDNEKQRHNVPLSHWLGAYTERSLQMRALR